MKPALYSADLRWRVIWFVHILQNSVAEALLFLGVCETTVERYISKFLVNGHVKPELVGRSHASISFAPRHCFCIPNHSSFRSCNLRSTTASRRSVRQRFLKWVYKGGKSYFRNAWMQCIFLLVGDSEVNRPA